MTGSTLLPSGKSIGTPSWQAPCYLKLSFEHSWGGKPKALNHMPEMMNQLNRQSNLPS